MLEFRNVISIKCPYCGFVNKLDVLVQDFYRLEDHKPTVITCDSEEGGCDRYFAIEPKLSCSVKIYNMVD